MDLLTLLNQNERILLEDNIEQKKTRTLINQINRSITDLMDTKHEFDKLAKSQLSGENHNKIAVAKGLLAHYSNWTAVINAVAKLKQQEKKLADTFYSLKNKILADIHALIKDSKKNPVICAYDCFDGDYVACKEGHYVVVLGDNNTAILTSMAKDLDYGIQIQGSYDTVESKELTADYSVVSSNSKMCQQKITELYSSSDSKVTKLKQAIASLEEEGCKVVFFVTHRKSLLNIGVSKKELDDYEKFITKRYLPYKNLLKKALRIEIPEIAVEIQVANEESFGSADDEGFVPASDDGIMLKMANIQSFARDQVQFLGDANAQQNVQGVESQPVSQPASQPANPNVGQPVNQNVNFAETAEPLNVDGNQENQ